MGIGTSPAPAPTDIPSRTLLVAVARELGTGTGPCLS